MDAGQTQQARTEFRRSAQQYLVDNLPVLHVRPEGFIDSEIIKEKLEALDAKLDKIIGFLEALRASLGKVSKKELKP